MLQRIKNLFRSPQPVGPAQSFKVFTPSDQMITQDLVPSAGEGWFAEIEKTHTFRLFEFNDPKVENCLLTYRVDLKSEALSERAYLEMWCRLPGQGEFFSKGFQNALKGINDWSSCDVPFYLKQGQRPDQIKLNLTVEGKEKVWIKNIEVLMTPLK